MNALSQNWENKRKPNKLEILISNAFFILLMNAISTPLYYLFNPFFWLRFVKRHFEIKKFEKDPNYQPHMTQGELNSTTFEYPDIGIAWKYAWLGKTVLLTVFYMPIFPLGAVFSFFGLLVWYWIEKYNVLYHYKRPEKIDGTITKTYVNTITRLVIFVYACSVWLFLSEVYKDHINWPLISIIIFGAFLIIPFSPLIKGIACFQVSGFNEDKYYDNNIYFECGLTYEMTNPLTKYKGFEHYLEKLHEKNIITHDEMRQNIYKIREAPSDIIELYYQKKHEAESKANRKVKTEPARHNKLLKGLVNVDKYRSNDAEKRLLRNLSMFGKGGLSKLQNAKKKDNQGNFLMNAINEDINEKQDLKANVESNAKDQDFNRNFNQGQNEDYNQNFQGGLNQRNEHSGQQGGNNYNQLYSNFNNFNQNDQQGKYD